MSKIYGYARVSSKDQNADRQLVALQNFGIDIMFVDKQSGKNFDRPQYKKNSAQTQARRRSSRKEYRPPWQKLRGNFGTVARNRHRISNTFLKNFIVTFHDLSAIIF